MRGIVEKYNRKKQVGSISYIAESHSKKVFCNKMDLANTDYLIQGDTIDFILGKGGHARDIFLIRKEG